MAARFGSTRTARVAATVVCRQPIPHGPVTRTAAGPSTLSPRATGVTVYSMLAGRRTFHWVSDGCIPGGTRSCTIADAPALRAVMARLTRLATPTESRSLDSRSARSTDLPGARRESMPIATSITTKSTSPTRNSAEAAAPAAMTAAGTSKRAAPRHVIAACSPRDRYPAHRALHRGHLGHALDLSLGPANHP